MIDTTTKGDPAQVRAAAEWLDPALKDAADTVSNGAALIPVAVRWHWFGESADAYVLLAMTLLTASPRLGSLRSVTWWRQLRRMLAEVHRPLRGVHLHRTLGRR